MREIDGGLPAGDIGLAAAEYAAFVSSEYLDDYVRSGGAALPASPRSSTVGDRLLRGRRLTHRAELVGVAWVAHQGSSSSGGSQGPGR